MADQTLRIPNTNLVLSFTDNLDSTYLLAVDTIRQLKNQDNAPFYHAPDQYESNGVAAISKAALLSIFGYNAKVSAQFIQLFDAVEVPADDAVPNIIIAVPASSNFKMDFPLGYNFGWGICWSNSSTGPTKTIGAADCWVNLQYIEFNVT